MALVTGNSLDPKKFFSIGQPSAQGSSFDLTIGCIFDHEGKKVEGPFTIKPGHMVQVVSFEVFNLSDCVTGHVTYKTTLTKKGIWALTVGIVDPGWKGPIATTLLNFSRVDHTIAEDDAFLRVSFFEHDPRKAPPLKEYLKDVQRTAASIFPATFLDSEKISEAAGNKVLTRIRTEALGWVALIAVLFTVMQLAFNFGRAYMPNELTKKDIDVVRTEVEALQRRLLHFEAKSGGQSDAAAFPPPMTTPPLATPLQASPAPVSPSEPRNP